MSLLLTIIIVILVIALAIYAVTLLPIDVRWKQLLQALIVLVAIFVILDIAGLLGRA